MGRLFLYHVEKDPPDQDINLLVTVTNRRYPGWIHVPQLSPSKDLAILLAQWQWDGKWPRKWSDFAKRYRMELRQPLKHTFMDHLLKRIDEGNDIAVACDCTDEKHCHKQIIGEWISDRGIEVVQGKEERCQRKFSAHQGNDIVQLTIDTFGKEGRS